MPKIQKNELANVVEKRIASKLRIDSFREFSEYEEAVNIYIFIFRIHFQPLVILIDIGISAYRSNS